MVRAVDRGSWIYVPEIVQNTFVLCNGKDMGMGFVHMDGR